MTQAKRFLPRIPLLLQRYGLAVSSVAAALGISLFLYNQKFEGVESPLFLIAVAVTVWYAGVGPAILALILAALAFNYYFTEPRYTFANVVLTILFIAGLCAATYSARRIILIFVFAILFAYLIDPVVKFLQRHSLFFKNLRGPAVVEVYVSIVVLLALMGYSFAPGVARNSTKLMDQVPALLDRLSTGDIAGNLEVSTAGRKNRNFA